MIETSGEIRQMLLILWFALFRHFGPKAKGLGIYVGRGSYYEVGSLIAGTIHFQIDGEKEGIRGDNRMWKSNHAMYTKRKGNKRNRHRGKAAMR